MKRKIDIIFCFVAIISAIIMISIFVYSSFVRSIDYKYQLFFCAGTISLISLNIHGYLEKSKALFYLILPLFVIVAAFIVSFL